MGRAAVPSGASTGAHEAVELRDGDKKRYLGKGVLKAVEAVNARSSTRIGGSTPKIRSRIDEAMIELDGTPNKARLGANAILGVSLAVAKAAADASGLPLYRYVGGTQARVLPVPMMNIINGGAHADNPIDFQEFMIMPVGAPTLRRGRPHGRGGLPHPQEGPARRPATTPTSATRAASRRTSPSAEAALDFVMKSIEQAGFKPGEDIVHRPRLRRDRVLQGRRLCLRGRRQDRRSEGAGRVSRRARRRTTRSPRSRTACRRTIGRAGRLLTDLIGAKCQLVGDDLFVTNVERLSEGIDEGVANSILVKVNQIGTLTETLAAVDMAHRAGYTAVMSHRSGETEDSTIADLAVATNCGQIKTGSLARSDRLAKYNQLIRIEEELGEQARYAGQGALKALG